MLQSYKGPSRYATRDRSVKVLGLYTLRENVVFYRCGSRRTLPTIRLRYV